MVKIPLFDDRFPIPVDFNKIIGPIPGRPASTNKAPFAQYADWVYETYRMVYYHNFKRWNRRDGKFE